MKKLWWMMAAWAMVQAGPAAAPAAAQADAVLLVTPARYLVMQVAFDVARRYPTVLVSYQGGEGEPVLHVWNGYEWMPLSLADYQSGAFLQTYPSRTVFLGDDALLPADLRSIGAWCTQSTQVPNLETHEMVNAIGRYLPFTPRLAPHFAAFDAAYLELALQPHIRLCAARQPLRGAVQHLHALLEFSAFRKALCQRKAIVAGVHITVAIGKSLKRAVHQLLHLLGLAVAAGVLRLIDQYVQ